MKFKDRYDSELYKDFRHLRNTDVYAQIRFYERHADELYKLSIEEQFTIKCYYANALFAAEEYERYLQTAPEILEISIVENIQFVDATDVYLHSLEKMSLAHLYLNDFSKAEKIATQLYHISAGQKKYRMLLKKILKKQRPSWVLNLFALSVLLLFCWTAFEVAQMIILEPFYSQSLFLVGLLKNSILMTAFIAALLAAFGHYLYVERIFRKIRTK